MEKEEYWSNEVSDASITQDNVISKKSEQTFSTVVQHTALPTLEEEKSWFSFRDPLQLRIHFIATYHADKSLQHSEHKYWAHQIGKSPTLPATSPNNELPPRVNDHFPAVGIEFGGNTPEIDDGETPIPNIPVRLSMFRKGNGSNDVLSISAANLSGRSSRSMDSVSQTESGKPYGELSVAERMARVMGLAVTHESVAKYSHVGVGDDELSEELGNVFASFKKCLELRQKYMEYSFQCDGDNPKDHDDFEIYPPPPAPSYLPPTTPIMNIQPPAKDEPFDFEKCKIPEKHE
ncbi:AMP deaminase, partial [Nowakowskiella sp. JEL0078]